MDTLPFEALSVSYPLQISSYATAYVMLYFTVLTPICLTTLKDWPRGSQ